MSEFERWEGRFAAPGYVFGEAPNAFLAAQAARLPASGRTLAVADGEGRNGVWLAERGLDVVSMDFSPTAQAKARRLAASRGVTITTELADIAANPGRRRNTTSSPRSSSSSWGHRCATRSSPASAAR